MSDTEVATIEAPKFLDTSDLNQAMEGSYYTIAGTGGDLNEWIEGYTKLMDEAGVGKPTRWFTTNGGAINAFARSRRGLPIHPNDIFPSDLTFLMFPLEGTNTGLAAFKVRMEDRWFDDIIANMRGIKVVD